MTLSKTSTAGNQREEHQTSREKPQMLGFSVEYQLRAVMVGTFSPVSELSFLTGKRRDLILKVLNSLC